MASEKETEYTDEQVREYQNWINYYNRYGALGDWFPVDIEDYYSNHGKAQRLLQGYINQEEKEPIERPAEQERLYREYLQWASRYAEPGDWYATDIDDFFRNYDKAMEQQRVWEQRGAEAEVEEEYLKAERYKQTPEYGQVFNPWLEEQTGFSGAMEQFTEREYPSLLSRFQATQPRLTGYPTREEARAEADRRKAAFGAWLGQESPEIYQKYMGQPPLMRGERPYMYQPTMRTVNW
jgi:hypothetical protein